MRLSVTRIAPLVLFAVSTLAIGDATAQHIGTSEVGAAMQSTGERATRGAPRVDNGRAERGGHDRSEEQRALSAAVRRVESRTGGKVLSAERIPFDGRDVSRIKVVDAKGRVRVYMDDPHGSGGRSANPAGRAPTRDDDN